MFYEENWGKTHDGLRLRAKNWSPDGEVSAVLVFVHGFTEHSGRYDWVAERLGQHGMAMVAFDLRGHGQSQGDRVWVRSLDDYLADVEGFVERAGQQYPGKPLFLLGHSLGGNIVTLLAIQRPTIAAGIIVSAAALKLPPRLFPLLRRFAGIFSVIAPRLRLVRLGVKRLSRDPQVVAQFEHDPLNFHGRFPVRMGAEILRAVRLVGGRMEQLQTPLLILHGSGDAVADPEGASQLHARAGSADKTLKIYEGLYHDLFHEPEREQVLSDVLQWIEARIGANKG